MPQITVGDLGSYIREQRKSAQLSLRQLSRSAGVSNPYLSQIERGLRHPSAEILQQIAKALRISAEALYVQAGILEAPRSSTGVTDAIFNDRFLTDRQKQALVEVYQAFCAETAGVVATQVGEAVDDGAPARLALVPADMADAADDVGEDGVPERAPAVVRGVPPLAEAIPSADAVDLPAAASWAAPPGAEPPRAGDRR